MNTTPCPQPPGEPFDGKPRVIVVKEELEQLEAENKMLNDDVQYWIQKHDARMSENIDLLLHVSKLRAQLAEQRNKVLEEAASAVRYWANGHKSRLRSFPLSCCIKSEIKDCEELERHILALRTQPAKERNEK